MLTVVGECMVPAFTSNDLQRASAKDEMRSDGGAQMVAAVADDLKKVPEMAQGSLALTAAVMLDVSGRHGVSSAIPAFGSHTWPTRGGRSGWLSRGWPT